MNLWTMIVIIVAIGTFSEICKTRIRANEEESEESIKEISQHLSRLKDRVANLETIVLEKERNKQFSDLEKC